MTLLREIQAAATDSSIEISTVLRKAKMLAARLRNPEFEAWVDRELNGYDPDGEDVPPYREIHGVVQGTLSDGYRLWNNVPIMTSFLPEKFRAWGGSGYLRQPISEIAAMAAMKRKLQAPWPQELAVKFGAKGYTNGWQCIGAWRVISSTALTGVVESVRNRVLEFALKIEGAAPNAGDIPAGAPAPIPQDKVTQIFNTYVVGDGNNIAPAGSHISQRATAGIEPGDLDSLLSRLRELGIPADQVEALKRATQSGSDPKAAAEGWVGKLAMSAATGATTGAITLASKAVAQYLGIYVT
ncbi:MAG: hypothetical protein ACM336_15160 [Acidobacteriota bacterium]